MRQQLHNLANDHPLARLKAIHELRGLLEAQLRDAFDLAEFEQIQRARHLSKPSTWSEVGRQLGGVSHTQARRRYEDALGRFGR
jgi:hypothetical protein